jgi:hypothetical protein
MNPVDPKMLAMMLGQGGGQPPMGGMGMPPQGMPQGMPQPPMGAPVTVPGQDPPLTLAALNGMKKNALPNDWINKLSPEERSSIMPQWSNG